MTIELEAVGPSFRLPFEFRVVGTGFDGRASAIRRFAKRGAQVRLEREPDNAHDTNAIAVILLRKNDRGTPMEEHIGYVPADLAAEMAELTHARRLSITKTEISKVKALDGDDYPRISILVDGTLGDGIVQKELPVE